MPRPPLRALPGVACSLLLLAAGCAGPGPGPGSAPATELVTPSTTRSLVAAVSEHLDRPPAVAAPLAPRDGVPRGSLGVEVAFDEAEGDNSHVTLVVGPADNPYADLECGRGELRAADGCEQSTTDDGGTTILTWTRFAPESDPGGIQAIAQRDDRVVSAFYYGRNVLPDLLDGDLAPLADDLVALVADPGVGFDTTRALSRAGEEIPDAVLLDWYGQGNGLPPPRGYREGG